MRLNKFIILLLHLSLGLLILAFIEGLLVSIDDLLAFSLSQFFLTNALGPIQSTTKQVGRNDNKRPKERQANYSINVLNDVDNSQSNT